MFSKPKIHALRSLVVVGALALSSGTVAADRSKNIDDCRDNFTRSKASETCRVIDVDMKYGKHNWCRITAACPYIDDQKQGQVQRTHVSERLDRVWQLRNCSGELQRSC